jgi:hypothetical protein
MNPEPGAREESCGTALEAANGGPSPSVVMTATTYFS